MCRGAQECDRRVRASCGGCEGQETDRPGITPGIPVRHGGHPRQVHARLGSQGGYQCHQGCHIPRAVRQVERRAEEVSQQVGLE